MAELMLVNPRKLRRRKTRMRSVRRYRRIQRAPRKSIRLRRFSGYIGNPRRRRRFRIRRNPIGFSIQSFTKDTLIPSAVGAAGALGLDVIMGFLPLPDAVKSGPMRPIVRIAGAIGIGMLAGMVTSRRTAEQVTAGAVTVVLYDLIKGFVQTQFPALRLGETDEYPVLEYMNPAIMVDETTDAITDESEISAYVPSEEMSAYVS